MTVFVCVDDNCGISFNNRRQSRDSKIIKTVFDMVKDGVLYTDSYSEGLFEGYDVNVDAYYLNKATDRDFCFVEKTSLKDYEDKIKTLVLFKWNKVYPSDMKLDVSLDNRTLENTFDFKGTSHDKITCEVWVK